VSSRTGVSPSRRRGADRGGRLLAAVALIAAVLGLSTALAAAPAAAGSAVSATVCRDMNLGGTCETFLADAPDLRVTPLGDDAASSLHVATGTYLSLYRDLNYTGVCETFTIDNNYLLGSIVDNDQATSLRVTSTPTGCPKAASGLVWACYSNNSSANVTTADTGSDANSVIVGFTNWNLSGDQTAGIKLFCSTIS
jgi:hypothetical protein